MDFFFVLSIFNNQNKKQKTVKKDLFPVFGFVQSNDQKIHVCVPVGVDTCSPTSDDDRTHDFKCIILVLVEYRIGNCKIPS